MYQKSGPTRRHSVEIPIDAGASWRQPVPSIETATISSAGLAELMQKQLLAEFAPASVLINRKFEVLCFQGPTVNYLEFPSGEPTRDLLALARQGLRTRLRALVSAGHSDRRTGHRLRPPREAGRPLLFLPDHRQALQ